MDQVRRSYIRVAAATAAIASVTVVLAGVVAIIAYDVALRRAGRDDLAVLSGGGAAFLVGMLSATAVGVVLLRTHPLHPVGWCFAALGPAIALPGAAQAYGSWAVFVADDAAAGAVAAVVASNGFIVWEVLLGLVYLLTPDGRPVSRRWRWVGAVLVGSGVVWLLAATLMPGPLEQAPFLTVENPFGTSVPGLGGMRLIGSVGTTASLVACVASILVRWRRSEGVERQQLAWVAVGVVPLPVLVVIMFASARTDADVVLEVAAGLVVALVPVSVALSITRYHLFDVERILSRAIAYALLSLSLAATYTAVVLLVGDGIGGLAGSSTISVASATAIVAVGSRPLHTLIQDAVDRRFARRRYDALRIVADHVSSPRPGDDIERVLRHAVRDPSLAVAYWVGERHQWVTADGRAAMPSPEAVRIERAGVTVAAISATTYDEMLRAVIREAEPTLESTGLRAAVALQLQEVRASRARIATAQLYERRRIERDLHDGVQQRLLAVSAQLQAALLNGEPDRQRNALREGVEQCRAAVSDLRTLTNGLHPAVLTEGGLGAALDELATRLPVRVHVDEPDRRWPPELEATAWFVACEAVANAFKHATAATVRVESKSVGSTLVLQIRDDGLGGADASGGGLRGLADRVEAVGGQFRVTSTDGVGTMVEAVLPCGS